MKNRVSKDMVRAFDVRIQYLVIRGSKPSLQSLDNEASKTTMPHTSSKDLTSIAALELSNALQNPAPAAPFSHIVTAQLQEL
jgi:hypothetical protein